MRYMGIDYGTKRVGVALSDESGSMAFPHSVLPNDATLIPALTKLIEKESVEEVVIGHSVDAKGQENVLQQHIDEFTGTLTLAVGVPIHLEPEQYSTQEALRTQGRTEKTDASAAAIILNSYLLKNNSSEATAN